MRKKLNYWRWRLNGRPTQPEVSNALYAIRTVFALQAMMEDSPDLYEVERMQLGETAQNDVGAKGAWFWC